VRQGWHFWNQRTRTGCERAIDCFTRAIAETPSEFRAFEGLSASYLTLAIFGMRHPKEMYPRFLEAHEQAVALNRLRPELRCNRAFGLCVFEHRADESEAEFLRTLDEKPSLGSTYVRLALLYGSLGRFDDAFESIGRGKQQDPLLPTLAACEVLVRCWQRDFETAVQLGRQGIELHPYLQVLRVNYGQALQSAGRADEALAQYQIASIMSPDVPWLRALEGACQAALGRRRDARAMLQGLEALRRSEYVDAYYMAVLRSALGQTREALAELDRATAENSAWLYTLDVDPMLDAAAGRAGFGMDLAGRQNSRLIARQRRSSFCTPASSTSRRRTAHAPWDTRARAHRRTARLRPERPITPSTVLPSATLKMRPGYVRFPDDAAHDRLPFTAQRRSAVLVTVIVCSDR
jgi:tetratricopeptide (TPR) repeat protein